MKLIFCFFCFIRKSPKPTSEKEKAGKKPRVWDLGGSAKDAVILDRSKDRPEDMRSDFTSTNQMIGSMKGGIQDLEVESEDEEEYSSSEDDDINQNSKQTVSNGNSTGKKAGGVFSMFKNFVGSKNLTRDDMQVALDKLRDHLIGKNLWHVFGIFDFSTVFNVDFS